MHRAAWLAVAAANGLIALMAQILTGVILPGTAAAETIRLVATGAAFQMVHALAIMALCGLGWPRDNVAWLFFYGTLFFAGGLYLRAIAMPAWVLGVAAFGGLLAALGWLILMVTALTHPRA